MSEDRIDKINRLGQELQKIIYKLDDLGVVSVFHSWFRHNEEIRQLVSVRLGGDADWIVKESTLAAFIVFIGMQIDLERMKLKGEPLPKIKLPDVESVIAAAMEVISGIYNVDVSVVGSVSEEEIMKAIRRGADEQTVH